MHVDPLLAATYLLRVYWTNRSIDSRRSNTQDLQLARIRRPKLIVDTVPTVLLVCGELFVAGADC